MNTRAKIWGTLVSLVALFAASPVLADYTITNSTSVTVSDGLTWGGGAGGGKYQAQSFTTSAAGTIASTTIYSVKDQTPPDSAFVSIQADSSGLPSGTDLGTSSTFVPSNTYPTTATPNLATFSSPVSVSASTQYWIVYQRSGTYTNSNGYDAAYSASGGGSYVQVNGVWSSNGVHTLSNVIDVVTTAAATPSPQTGAWSYWW